MKSFRSSLCICTALLLVACTAPKPTIVEEPKTKPVAAPKIAAVPTPPPPSEADQLRLPNELGQMPEKDQFRATNPGIAKKPDPGAPVIAKPPSSPTPDAPR